MIKSDWNQSNPFIFSKFSHLLRSMIRGRTRKRPTTGLKFPGLSGIFRGRRTDFTLWGLSDLEELPPALVEPVTWSPLKIRRYRKTLSVFAKIDWWLTDWEYIVKSKGLDGSIQNKIGVTYCYNTQVEAFVIGYQVCRSLCQYRRCTLTSYEFMGAPMLNEASRFLVSSSSGQFGHTVQQLLMNYGWAASSWILDIGSFIILYLLFFWLLGWGPDNRCHGWKFAVNLETAPLGQRLEPDLGMLNSLKQYEIAFFGTAAPWHHVKSHILFQIYIQAFFKDILAK